MSASSKKSLQERFSAYDPFSNLVPSNNTESGIFETWYPGTKTPLAKGPLDIGKPHGRWQLWHDNGQLWQEADFHQGTKNGCWEVYYDTGHRWISGTYKNDIKTGKWTYFWPNGAVMSHGCFDMGEKAGLWFMLDDEGNTINETDYSAVAA